MELIFINLWRHCRQINTLLNLPYSLRRVLLILGAASTQIWRDDIPVDWSIAIYLLWFWEIVYVCLCCRRLVLTLSLSLKLDMPAAKTATSTQSPLDLSLHHVLVELRSCPLLFVVAGRHTLQLCLMIAITLILKAEVVTRFISLRVERHILKLSLLEYWVLGSKQRGIFVDGGNRLLVWHLWHQLLFRWQSHLTFWLILVCRNIFIKP